MTVRPRYRQEESARIRGKAPTIDSQILTDVLAQWIPVSPGAGFVLFFPLFLSSRERRTLVSDRRRMVNAATRSASSPLSRAQIRFFDISFTIRKRNAQFDNALGVSKLLNKLYATVASLATENKVTYFLTN